jgi:PGAP1-like protein
MDRVSLSIFVDLLTSDLAANRYLNAQSEDLSILTRTRSDGSFLERRIRSLTLRRPASENTIDITGPLGLNLLSQPSDTYVDFIFVHGLRGGSRKTWSASPNPAHFWPKEWLPADPDFKNVRIHSFGYNSDWMERRDNPLSVHDFGQSLIEELYNSPALKRDQDTSIVLIGHSMGGLVIKKACIISRQNPTFYDIGKRIHSIFFLATPHRGSDLAQTLNNVLRVMSTGSRPFVANLERGSEATQILNDQFRHCYKGIHIHSFIESVPMNWGVGVGLVVDKESSTLGLPVTLIP